MRSPALGWLGLCLALPASAQAPNSPQASDRPRGENGIRSFAPTPPAWGELMLTAKPDAGVRGFALDPAKEWLFDALPDLKTSPAPKWVKPGTRLNYYGASATVPTNDHHYWPDADGDWVDDAGNRYRREDAIGGGGEGVTQVTVGYVGNKLVTLDTQLFLLTGDNRPPMLFAGAGSVEPAAAAADYWIHPDVLADIPDRIGKTAATFRMPFTAGGKKYNAIRFHVRGPAGRLTYIFDLASGVMLHMNHIVRTKDGVVSTFVTYLGRRDLDLPWADGTPPDWAAEVSEMRYEGTQSVSVAGSSPLSVPVSVKAGVTDRGKRWTAYDLTVAAGGYEGLPGSDATTRRTCGAAQIGGMWVPPEGLADLRRGTVLDEDPVTKFKTVVSQVARDKRGRTVVEVSQENGAQLLTYQYDRDTGTLVGFGRLDRHPATIHTFVSLRSVR